MKQFLATPDDYGWEVKRKLIWLGTRSYLFRAFFKRYVEEQEAKVFRDRRHRTTSSARQCTRWSGLGALDDPRWRPGPPRGAARPTCSHGPSGTTPSQVALG